MSTMSVYECVKEFVRSMRENGHGNVVALALRPDDYAGLLGDIITGSPAAKMQLVNMAGDTVDLSVDGASVAVYRRPAK